MTVIAVPVRKFSRIQFAFSGMPFAANQLAITMMLPAIKTTPIIPITMSFRIRNVMIVPFKMNKFAVQHSTTGIRAQEENP